MFQNQNKKYKRFSKFKATPKSSGRLDLYSTLLTSSSTQKSKYVVKNSEKTISLSQKSKFQSAQKHVEKSPSSHVTCASTHEEEVSDFRDMKFAQNSRGNFENMKQIVISDCEESISQFNFEITSESSEEQQDCQAKWRSAIVCGGPSPDLLNLPADKPQLKIRNRQDGGSCRDQEEEELILSDQCTIFAEIEKLLDDDEQEEEEAPRLRAESPLSCNHSMLKESQNQFDFMIQNKSQRKNSVNRGGIVDNLVDSCASRKHNFSPSTPFVHKFRTEMCKSFELYGKCQFGDECSFAHGKQQMMAKSDVSALYKTKDCRKYTQNGYCPYGQRCQFIHRERESTIPKSEAPVDYIQELQENEYVASHVNKKAQSYSDILVHCINISFQEHQKKKAMFKKQIQRKHHAVELQIYQPDLQYMNIYEDESRRLSCFHSLTSRENGSESLSYHHCDASQYGGHLDQTIKKAQQLKRIRNMQPFYYNPVPPQNLMVHSIMEKISNAIQTPLKANLKISKNVFRPTYNVSEV